MSCVSWSLSLLTQRWSPQQISRQLRLQFPGEPGMWLCHEIIYQAVYQRGSSLRRPSPLAPHRRSPLRSARDHRRAHQRSRPSLVLVGMTLGLGRRVTATRSDTWAVVRDVKVVWAWA